MPVEERSVEEAAVEGRPVEGGEGATGTGRPLASLGVLVVSFGVRVVSFGVPGGPHRPLHFHLSFHNHHAVAGQGEMRGAAAFFLQKRQGLGS